MEGREGKSGWSGDGSYLVGIEVEEEANRMAGGRGGEALWILVVVGSGVSRGDRWVQVAATHTPGERHAHPDPRYS